MHCLILLALLAPTFAQLTKINDAVGEFTIALLKSTLEENVNTIHSPYSIWSALGMCLVGAKDDTVTNMESNMFIPGMSLADFQTNFKLSTAQMNLAAATSKLGFTALKANRIYVSKFAPISSDFVDTVRDVFEADAKSVDFGADGPTIKTDINSFVSNVTHKLIPTLLDEVLEPNTLIALINALYFKGSWKNAMRLQPSFNQLFNEHLNHGGEPANWTGVVKSFRYGINTDLEATLIELPYVDNLNSTDKASMVIIFPDDQHKDGIKDWVDSKFDWQTISKAILSNSETEVDLKMPKFDIESSFQLSGTLEKLGMTVPFSDKANFTGMVEPKDAKLQISKVIHKAKMTVDEKGTEAAAATAITIVRNLPMAPIDPIGVELTINRTFVALIVLRQDNGNSIVPLFTSVISRLS